MANWINACAAEDIDREDLYRFDHAGRTYLVYRSPEDLFFCTDGICSHEKVHLADGLVMDHEIECPKHGARFDYRSGEVLSAPACVNLATFPVKVEDGQIYIEI